MAKLLVLARMMAVARTAMDRGAQDAANRAYWHGQLIGLRLYAERAYSGYAGDRLWAIAAEFDREAR